MFDKKTVDAYKQITEPDELKEKVMAACLVDKAPEKRNFFGTMRMYATLAACFVLVIVFSVFAVGKFRRSFDFCLWKDAYIRICNIVRFGDRTYCVFRRAEDCPPDEYSGGARSQR